MSQIARQLRRGKAGFSLIELVIVAVIVAILTLIAVPFFRGTIVQRRMSGAASQILGDIRQMQSSAIAQGRMYRLVTGTHTGVNPIKSNQYCIQWSADQGNTWTPSDLNAGCTWVNLPVLYPNTGMGFSIKDNPEAATLTEVRFNSRGLASHPTNTSFPFKIDITTTGENPKRIQIFRTGGTKAP
jgi:prepilin-type N-terminal cleavage/methylation domain-containing protein